MSKTQKVVSGAKGTANHGPQTPQSEDEKFFDGYTPSPERELTDRLQRNVVYKPGSLIMAKAEKMRNTDGLVVGLKVVLVGLALAGGKKVMETFALVFSLPIVKAIQSMEGRTTTAQTEAYLRHVTAIPVDNRTPEQAWIVSRLTSYYLSWKNRAEEAVKAGKPERIPTKEEALIEFAGILAQDLGNAEKAHLITGGNISAEDRPVTVSIRLKSEGNGREATLLTGKYAENVGAGTGTRGINVNSQPKEEAPW